MALDRRQQTAASSTNAASASSASNAGSSASAVTTASASAGSSAPAIGITGGPGFNPNATHSISIAPNGQAGGIQYTDPAELSTLYCKIAPSQLYTFGWNFTNLLVTPTAITAYAACANSFTYPVGPTDGVIPGDASSVVWYPYGYQTDHPNQPLPQAICTLQLFADGGPSAAPTPGYLAPNDQLRFALYTPQPYTPLASGWQCAGCGGALGQFKAHPASIALVTTLLVVFLSGFTTLRRVWD